MRTLIPPAMEAAAVPFGKGRFAIGFALTPRALLLLVAGVLLAVPAFFARHLIWMMPLWDAGVLLVALADACRLPPPGQILVERRMEHALYLGKGNHVILTVTQSSARRLRIGVMDALHASLSLWPKSTFITAYPAQPAELRIVIHPAKRGDVDLGAVFLRCRSFAGLAERWATAPLEDTVRVLPSAIGSSDDALLLIRARQIELERKRVRRIGIGREFESLRDYQAGDEVRNLSWTATARRGKPITRTFTTERSQQVWTVIDAGRLSRTSFEVQLPGSEDARPAEFLQEVAMGGSLHLQQIDQAASAAMLLAQVVERAGDRSGLLAYGRGVQQEILPGRGVLHLRRMLDALALVKAERAEADHRRAGVRLRKLQGRRSLICWITEMPESAATPDVLLAVADLARRHLVVLLLLEHPELSAYAQNRPQNAAEMFAIAAANEMLTRRRLAIAQMERRGVLVAETSPEKVGIAAVNQYLEIKMRGAL